MIGWIGASFSIFFIEWVLGANGGLGLGSVFLLLVFSILINGSPKGFFPAQRGFRQVDSLSHFPLVIIGEALSSMVVMAVEANLIRGFRLALEAPVSSVYNLLLVL